MHHNLFIIHLVIGIWGCFQFFAVLYEAAVNFYGEVFVWTCAFISLGEIPEGNAGTYGRYMFHFLTN